MRLACKLFLLAAAAHASQLHEAVQTCDVAQIRQLIAAGTSLNETNAEGNTAMHNAVRAGQAPCVYLLLQAGANRYPPNCARQTVHQIARLYPDPQVRAQMLVFLETTTAITMDYAALRGLEPAVRVLIAAGEDPNIKANDGRTPLQQAALKGHTAIAALLLEHGASIEAKDRSGARPLHDAALSGNTAVLQLLLNRGANPNAATDDTGETPLHLAASWGRIDSIRALISAGANPSARDHQGRTPLDLAIHNNQEQAVRILR